MWVVCRRCGGGIWVGVAGDGGEIVVLAVVVVMVVVVIGLGYRPCSKGRIFFFLSFCLRVM